MYKLRIYGTLSDGRRWFININVINQIEIENVYRGYVVYKSIDWVCLCVLDLYDEKPPPQLPKYN